MTTAQVKERIEVRISLSLTEGLETQIVKMEMLSITKDKLFLISHHPIR